MYFRCGKFKANGGEIMSDEVFKQHKKYLMRYIHAKRRIDELEDGLFELDKHFEMVRKSGGTVSRIQGIERDELNDRINERLIHARLIRTEIATAIETLENPDQARVLELRFLDNVKLSEIPQVMNFGLSWIEELYRNGLHKITIPDWHV